MAQNSKIEWTNHTFNPWWGCTPVSEECVNCYAKAFATRCGKDCFGAGKPRETFGEKHWREPLKWNAAAEASDVRAKVFSGSMCDIFDPEGPIEVLPRLMRLIRDTPHLDWLLLTKHVDGMLAFAEAYSGDWPTNIWPGVTAGCQRTWDVRVPKLITLRGILNYRPVLWVSVEPMLERIHAAPFLGMNHEDECGIDNPNPSPDPWGALGFPMRDPWVDCIEWVIAGCESGPKARPIATDAIRSLRDQCVSAHVSFFLKQMVVDGKLVKMPELDGRVWAEMPEVSQ